MYMCWCICICMCIYIYIFPYWVTIKNRSCYTYYFIPQIPL